MRIMCFGDSNTWGYQPGVGKRYNNRWTKILQDLLPEATIIEEGLNGRTTVFEDPLLYERQGLRAVPIVSKSQQPIDLVVIMLGTNDLKNHFNPTADKIAQGLRECIKAFKKEEMYSYKVPEILVVSPVLVTASIEPGDVFDKRSIEVSKELADSFEKVSQEEGCYFMRAQDYARASDIDGVHLDEENHKLLGQAIYNKIKEII